MKLRSATTDDLLAINQIIQLAKEYFYENGINQWQDGYPNMDSILQDLQDHVLYVIEHQDKIIASAAIIKGMDPYYQTIEQGNWLCDTNEYYAIHRIAVLPEYKGKNIASLFLTEASKQTKESHYQSLRADTHEDNHSMQRFLLKNKFQYCGIVYVNHHAKRYAYEKIID